MFHPRAKPAHNLPDARNLLEFRLQLVNLAQDGAETGDFRVGHLDRVPGAVVLGLGGGFRGAVELRCQTDISVLVSDDGR